MPTRSCARHGWVLAIGFLGVLLLAGLLNGGCSGGTTGSSASTAVSRSASGSVGVTTSSVTAATPSTVPATTTLASATTLTTVRPTATTVLSSSEKRLGNGLIRAGGFVKRTWSDGQGRHLEIDYADFLTGKEAEQAAAASGGIAENDYFIRNQSLKLRTFRVADSVVIDIPQGDPTSPKRADWAEFTDYVSREQGQGTYWWIERRGDEIVSIEGQWTP
jgi:hypothetical protein